LSIAAEEIRDASITLPRAIMWSVAINASLGFIMAVTLVFTLGDVDSLFASVTRQPFIQLFYNATQSYAATNVMTAIVIILLAACCVSELATASRQIWSFARDRGVPGWQWISRVSVLYVFSMTAANF
jgi:choline transport protein